MNHSFAPFGNPARFRVTRSRSSVDGALPNETVTEFVERPLLLAPRQQIILRIPAAEILWLLIGAERRS